MQPTFHNVPSRPKLIKGSRGAKPRKRREASKASQTTHQPPTTNLRFPHSPRSEPTLGMGFNDAGETSLSRKPQPDQDIGSGGTWRPPPSGAKMRAVRPNINGPRRDQPTRMRSRGASLKESCSGTLGKEASSGASRAHSAHPAASPGNPGELKADPSQVPSSPGGRSALGHRAGCPRPAGPALTQISS